MALNSSGPISLGGNTTGQSIEGELNGTGGGVSTISLNDSAVRSLANIPSGTISMPTNFWSKSTTLAWTYRVNFVNMWASLSNSPTAKQIIYANGAYIGAAYDAAGCAIRSTDGVAWTKYVLPWAQYTVATGIAYNGSTHCIVGAPNRCATSTDGINWTNQSGLSAISVTPISIAWSGSVFCVVGTGGTCATSPDGVTWTSQANFATAYGTNAGAIANAKIIYANSIFVAQAYDTTSGSYLILTSPDGVTWTAKISTSSNIADIAYSPQLNLFLSLGSNSFILQSTNGGSSWSFNSSLNTVAGGVTFNSIIWDGGKFIAGGNGGKVYTSYTGSGWFNQSTALQATSFGTNNVITIASNGTQTVVGGVYGATSP